MPQFVCCGINFASESTYIEHRQKVHGEQPQVKYTCCGIRFYTAEGYGEHRQQVHGESAPSARKGLLARLFKRS
ncbi:MAG: hypothetical protein M1136_04310 [Chloroflexi bacterium]|nr:hypothetical protein [Chloroflexota bacterium]